MRKILLIVFLISAYSYSDQPPDWEEFIIQSENKKWSAAIVRKRLSKEPWKDEWDLKIYKGFYLSIPAPNVSPAWSTQYNPSGYSGGYLSNDGAAFSYVEFWYYENHPVVKIYLENCSTRKKGSYFKVGNNLQKTVSHELWLKESGNVKYRTVEGKLFLQLETVNGIRRIDATCNEKT